MIKLRIPFPKDAPFICPINGEFKYFTISHNWSKDNKNIPKDHIFNRIVKDPVEDDVISLLVDEGYYMPLSKEQFSFLIEKIYDKKFLEDKFQKDKSVLKELKNTIKGMKEWFDYFLDTIDEYKNGITFQEVFEERRTD